MSIVPITSHSYQGFQVTPVTPAVGNRVRHYTAVLNRFRLQLVVLVVNKSMSRHQRVRLDGKTFPLEEGEPGQVELNVVSAEDFDFSTAFFRVAMSKICSFLGIGPSMITNVPFDLVCY